MLSKLTTEPYRGTRDFYPEDMYYQNYIFNKMRQLVEQYGYIEYGASVLEPTELYKVKSGDEIVNQQSYSFIDRGERGITLRPEMTPTVARMIAHKRKELAMPLRWYSIPNLFRYERPQRGRLREHWQLNVDLFGIEGIEADAEVITIASDLMKTFGAKTENFEVLINNRKLTNFLTKKVLELDEKSAYGLSKLLDRKRKISNEEFIAQTEAVIGAKSTKLMQILSITNIDELPDHLGQGEGVTELYDLFEILTKRGITNIKLDLSLMRGFDYYTGTVFEIFDTNPTNKRSLFGGGRYDDLVSVFGVDRVPGIGFGMGDVTIKDYMETYDLLPKYISPADLYICRMGSEFSDFANKLAMYLRQEGLKVAVDYTDRKLALQIKTAEKQTIPSIICIGEEEVKMLKFRLKSLFDGKEQEAKWEDLPNLLIENRNAKLKQ